MNDETNEIHYEEHPFTPPRFFQHVDLFKTFETAKPIDQKKLINIINHLHFTDNPLFTLLKHPVYQDSLLVKVHPEPCIKNQLTCRWDESYFQNKLGSYHPLCLTIFYNSFMTIVPFKLLSSDNNSFTIQLPEKSYALNQRQSQRYPCDDITAELIQSDFVAMGELIDFSSMAFRIKISTDKLKHSYWFNVDAPVCIRLFSNETIIYSEFCRCIRWQNDNNIWKEIVFASESLHISRFPTKKIRNPRRQINPPLIAVFSHPFIKKRIQRNIFEISSTGFSIRSKLDDEVLLPGMTIPRITIHFAGISIANCMAQIIYRRIDENNVQYGFAILDMDIHSYSRINHVLGIHSDSMVSISTEIDMDALWEFFFQAGFIYPEKYGFCQAHRKNFIETYRKLYQENSEIARHITYEKNGRIYGHISMIRAYERTWLIQHHAAMSIENKLAGFDVLRHIMMFANGMYQLPSAQMDYCICYFRPDNKFPDRVFGGFSRNFSDPQACSLDLFAYLTIPIASLEMDLPKEWILRESTSFDLWQLEQFYKNHSGGLFLNILHLGKSGPINEPLHKVFERVGLLRTYRIFSLIYSDSLKAIFIVDQSDLSINMSNLLNCIKVLITDSSKLSFELFSAIVSKLGSVYNLEKVTFLIYPASMIEQFGISSEKNYQLWILNMRYMNHFMEYVQKNFRIKYN